MPRFFPQSAWAWEVLLWVKYTTRLCSGSWLKDSRGNQTWPLLGSHLKFHFSLCLMFVFKHLWILSRKPASSFLWLLLTWPHPWDSSSVVRGGPGRLHPPRWLWSVLLAENCHCKEPTARLAARRCGSRAWLRHLLSTQLCPEAFTSLILTFFC